MKPASTPAQALSVRLPLKEVCVCTICAEHLAPGPRPGLQAEARARILIAGQAPGRKVHDSGVPFDDASGERLGRWMGVDHRVFYDPKFVAILPMGLCYPGTGKSGDLPPRRECAPQWRAPLLAALPNTQLTLLMGPCAQAWHLPGIVTSSLTETVKAWRERWTALPPLPHPSPRNNIWLKANPWFVDEIVSELQGWVGAIVERGWVTARGAICRSVCGDV